MIRMRNFVGVAEWPKASPLTPRPTPIISQVSGDDNSFQFVTSEGRSAELCLHRGTRAKHFGEVCGASNSPAPVETDRRPENVLRAARFAVGHCPCSLVGSAAHPRRHNETAEGEPRKLQS